MEKIEAGYKKASTTPSDIYRHLPYMRMLAEDAGSCYECGFRSGVSTWALLAGGGPVVSIDIEACDAAEHKAAAKEAGVKFAFRKQDSTTYTPREAPFGLTLLDTIHEYSQLSAELAHVSAFTEKYICIHDTDRRWEKEGRTYSAIRDFLNSEPGQGWKIKSHTEDLHGFTVLQKFV